MRLCLYFCQQFKRGGSCSKIYKERRLKNIGKTLFRVLIYCVVQNIFEVLFATVDLIWLFKFVMFLLVIKIVFQVAGGLPCSLICFIAFVYLKKRLIIKSQAKSKKDSPVL